MLKFPLCRMFFAVIISLFSVNGIAQSYKQDIAVFKETINTENKEEQFGLILKIKNKYVKELAKDPMQLAELDNSLGTYYAYKQNYDSAQACFARAVNGVYAVKTDTCFDYAFYLGNMAYILHLVGYYEVSSKYYEVALPRLAQYLGPTSEEYCGYVKQYVELKIDMGDYVTASTYNDALIHFYDFTYGKENIMYMACMQNKARIYQSLGRYQDAIAIQASIVDQMRNKIPLDTVEFCVGLNNLAYTYRLIGENDKALDIFLEAYRLEELCRKVSVSDRASLLNNMGIVYKAKCDYVNAAKCFQSSIDLYSSAGLSFSAEITNPCNNYGDMHRIMGNYKMAYQYLSYALNVRSKTSGEESETYANALVNLCLLTIEFHEVESAEEYCLKAASIYKKISGENTFNYANVMVLLSNIYTEKENYTEALKCLNTALGIMEKVVGKKHEYYARYLLQKSGVLMRMKKYDEALPPAQEAVDLYLKNYGEQNYNYVEALATLGSVADYAKQDELARSCYIRSIYRFNKIVNENMAYMSDEERLNFYEKSMPEFVGFESYVLAKVKGNKLFKDDSLCVALIDERLWTKSILLNESGKMQRFFQNNEDTTLTKLYTNWLNHKKFMQQIFQMSQSERDSNGINLADEELSLTWIEKELTEKSAVFRVNKGQENFASLQERLKPNERAVEIIKSWSFENDSTAKELYAALIISPQSNVPKIIVVDSSEYMDSLFVDRYRFNIHSNTTDKLSYNRFFGKISKSLEGVTKIYYSPDGAYQKLNLYTLYNPSTNKYLIDELEVYQLTSLNDINREENSANTGLSAVLFGYPDYTMNLEETKKKEENTVASRFGFSELPELPGTKVETEMISKVFKDKGWNTELYLAKEATEEKVKEIESPTIMHIATHGFFLPDLDYADEKILGFETETAKQNPLLRSGVIMAGAASHDTVTIKKEDGILTAYEASLLNLQNTELVTLSACETGLGDELINGQGVFGLQRAFLTAGAKSVLMSLWVVDDYATQELMTNFYTEWLKDYSPATKRSAFRKAQLEVKKRYPSPYYWGAFVMIGK